ncbi:class I SAM-dependent DNA methyltransferase [Paracoccus actinidiae]|uniref:class I SAM-dependent DNA methyltransferase n=1 Tax=Paracoccus actinidiae TaxID=3064531 RepID=UPI0027D26F2B|nr:DNA methyltransferase [Paracoccus sp. M09]
MGVDAPKPATADGQSDDYRFERPVTFIHTGTQSRGFIDLYRRHSFVMEGKQGTGASPADQLTLLPDAPAQRQGHGLRGTRRWDDSMLRARGQADSYARAVAREDGWPPFLLIVDVGHVIEVHADFSGQGQGYTQFPDGNRYRITLDDLRCDKTRDRLRLIWTDPASLDPARVSADVTRKVAGHLAELGRSFESQGHQPDTVARFLMRALFTMFAEDVQLIPDGAFSKLLGDRRGNPEHAAPMLQSLWATMNAGGFSPALSCDLKRFNGGLFRDATALPLNEIQLSLLIQAASHNWREVEPAIFGTLLERALDKRQRHKLGAHYTPRAYVERLVNPTVIEPLRAEWRDIQAAALTLAGQDRLSDARATVRGYHQRLCNVTVLDPACGSGNFLYVALELMKRLEGEVIVLLRDLGEDQGALALTGHTVDPHQFLGIEVNPWAAAVAELVLWIGYLQWHFRTHGNASHSDPILKDFRNIENRDAVLDWDGTQARLDAAGAPVTRWDGATTITHPVTGEAVPDPAARVAVMDYTHPRPATWPQADFIVGNPPFIGASRMRDALGDGYTEALRRAYPRMPESADFVMFWWDKAALALHGGKTRRLGLITTNSLRQTFNRQVLEPHLNDPKKPLSLAFAIPDHPWVDAGDGAAVRIAMTVAEAGSAPGRLFTVASEAKGNERAEGRDVVLSGQVGKIFSNLRIGADVAGAKALKANDGISSPGVKLHGAGFIVTPGEARALGLGVVPGLDRHIREYRNGRDLTAAPRGVMVIDLFGLSETEVRTRFPAVYQWVLDKVKPERDQNNRDSYRRNWWVHGEPRRDLRPALEGLPRYVATVETTKHRLFQFLGSQTLPDNMLIAIGTDDAALLSVLSSRFHVVWALKSGGTLEDRPRYNKSLCFDPFPFPDPTEAQKTRLRALGEELDAHRKAQQAAHPRLTLTGMYNVLEKLRAGERIEGRDKEIYDAGLVGILRDIHDRIDAAVADAYGWPVDLSDDDVLHRLVDLNRTRAAEEASGHVRWLRPEYQNPAGQAAAPKGRQSELDMDAAADPADKALWPKTLPEQIAAVRAALSDLGDATPDQVARHFRRARAATVQPLLDSLAALGQARTLGHGRYAI